MRGNRHVGGCCGGHGLKEKPHPEHQRSRSPTDRKRKKKKQAFVSPSRKYAQMNEEREEEFRNYKALVEQRFTQMLEDEKCKLKQQYAEKRDLLEKKVRFENEDRLREVQDQMKQEFAQRCKYLCADVMEQNRSILGTLIMGSEGKVRTIKCCLCLVRRTFSM